MRMISKFAVAAAIGLTMAQIAPASAETPKRGGTLVIGGGAGVRHLNPAVQSGGATGVPGTQIFAGLVELDDKFNAMPYLATSWEVGDNGLSYTFHLVEGATFHDGHPITSEDVAYSLNVVKNNHPFGIAMFAAVDKVDTPDKHTAVFRLNKPHPALLSALSPLLLPIIPKHYYDDGQEIKTSPKNGKPIGSGPFKLKEWKKGSHILLERNENFFRKGKPYLDKIIQRFMKDTTVRMLALEKGEIDYYSFTGVRIRDIPKMRAVPHLVLTTNGYAALGPVDYVEFNMRRKPVSDKRVRQAVAYAVDLNFVVEKLHVGVSHPGVSPFFHASPFHADGLKKYDVDLDKAKALLDEAGFKPGSDGMRLKLTLDYPPFQKDSMETVAKYMKPQLKKVGIDIQLRGSPDFPTWAKRIASWDYDMTLNNHWNYPDPVIGVHRIYLCGNIKNVIWSNTQGYCNKRVDELLVAAGSEMDFEKRKGYYKEFQHIVNDELPLYFLNEPPYLTIYNKKVKNVPLSVWGAMQPMDKVWLDQ